MRGGALGRMRYPLVEQADGDVYLETGNLVLQSGQLRFGSAEDVNLYRGAADTLMTDDLFRVKRGLANDRAIDSLVGAELHARLIVRADGKMEWSDGASATDTNLYRVAADVLKTDDALQIGSTLQVQGGSLALSNATGLGFVQLVEQSSDAAAGAANSARLYARDNGGGKTQLVVRFPTGAIQVLATEP